MLSGEKQLTFCFAQTMLYLLTKLVVILVKKEMEPEAERRDMLAEERLQRNQQQQTAITSPF
jgi:hypothetical protein